MKTHLQWQTMYQINQWLSGESPHCSYWNVQNSVLVFIHCCTYFCLGSCFFPQECTAFAHQYGSSRKNKKVISSIKEKKGGDQNLSWPDGNVLGSCREEVFTVKSLTRRHSLEKNTNLEERLTKRSEDRPVNLNHNKTPLSPTRRERSKAIIEEEPSTYENSPKVESTSSSRVSQCSEKITS